MDERNEAQQELDEFLTWMMLRTCNELGGPSVLSLEDALLVHKANVYFMAYLQEPAHRERLNGLLERAGLEGLEPPPFRGDLWGAR